MSDITNTELDEVTYVDKYLVKADNKLYTIVDNELVEIEDDPDRSLIDTFIEYGVDEVPNGDYLLTLDDFYILYWTDNEDEESYPKILQADVHAKPFPQFLYTYTYDTLHESIAGISIVEVVATDNVVFAASNDAGQTWYKFKEDNWVEVSDDPLDGMSKSQMNSITGNQWDAFITDHIYKFRIYLPTIDAEYTSLVVKYRNIT